MRVQRAILHIYTNVEDGSGNKNRHNHAEEVKVNTVACAYHSSIVATPKAFRISVPAHERHHANQKAQNPRENNHGYHASTGHHSTVRLTVNDGEIAVKVQTEYSDGEESEQ